MPVFTAKTFTLNLKRFFEGEGPQLSPYLLHYRRVYILPTKMGFVFAILLCAMLLGSINYDNSLGYLFTFLLASLAIVTIFHTYQNILNLAVGPLISKPVFAGQATTLSVQFDNRQHGLKLALQACIPNQSPSKFDLPAGTLSTIDIPMIFTQRGIQPMPRFVLYTIFPLGLFRAWSHIHLQQSLVVYATPSNDQYLPYNSIAQQVGEQAAGYGADDYDGLRNYQPGDTMHHIHWKSAARHQNLHTKQYIGASNAELWLNWHDSTKTEIEDRISQLTRWVMLADKAGIPYGLQLPNAQVDLNSGYQHKHHCLRLLATYGHR